MRGAFWLVVLMALGCAAGPDATDVPTDVAPTQTATVTPAAAVSTAPTPTATAAVTPHFTPAPTMPREADIEAELREPGTLTACLSVVGAPATALDEQGQLVGYNVSFATEIADRLGLELQTREPLFDALIDLVRGHECDIAVSSQNITANRLELVNFAAYTKSIQPVLVAVGNPSNIDTLMDLCGENVSANEGTTHVDLVNGEGDYSGEGLNAACSAGGQPPIELRTFETESHAATALLREEVVAYLGNSGFAQEFPGQIEFSNATLPPARQGITTALDRPTLHAAVEQTLHQMFSDGTYRAILVQHLPNEESVAVVSILE